MNGIEKKIKNYISRRELISQGDTLIVGVSGGADSMALIHFLDSHKAHYQINLKVAHVNHGIREEAKEEARYVEDWCKERDIPYFLHSCNISEIAKNKKMSEEEAGRQERYDFFKSLAKPGDKIAVAHHMNDQVETVLMNFFRGSDLKGIGGIRSKRGAIIRPLLGISKDEIITYCREQQISYYEDASNNEPIYTRNKLRLDYIPSIEKHINPNIQQTLVRQSELYQEANDFVEGYIQAHYSEIAQIREEAIALDLMKLTREHSYIQKKMIYHTITLLAKSHKNITQKHIIACTELLLAQSGKEIHLPYEIIAKRVYDKLIIKKQTVEEPLIDVTTLSIGENIIGSESTSVRLTLFESKTFNRYEENIYTKYVDYDKIKNTLQIRTRELGDFITLNNGKKKLKKLFIDEKVPQNKRDTTLLIVDGKEVVWVVGLRLSSKYFVTDKTKKILKLEIVKVDTQEGLC